MGSALCVALSKKHRIVAVDHRPPSRLLAKAAKGVVWEQADIADPEFVRRLKKKIFPRIGRIDIVVHLAAYYDFEKKWGPEYQRVNVFGIRTNDQGGDGRGCRTVGFRGQHRVPGSARRKRGPDRENPGRGPHSILQIQAEGEKLLARHAGRLPSVVLRIGGVFSDWCELPPLCSLVKQWKQPGILGRLMPGRGESGFPFIHRKDLVSAVRRIVEIEERLEKYQVLFASPDTHTSYRQLFSAVRSYVPNATFGPPINVPAFFISPILRVKKFAAWLRGVQTYERAWMLKFLDKPLRTDSSYSRAMLAWKPSEEYRIEKRIPVLMEHAIRNAKRWEERNVYPEPGKILLPAGLKTLGKPSKEHELNH